jgi:hypothetical protein
MNQLVVIITGLTVIAHSIFGCCGHHGISTVACTAQPCCAAAAEHPHQAHEAGSGCHADGAVPSTQAVDQDHDESGHSPAQGHQCEHKKCQWVSSRGDTSVDPQSVARDLPVSTPFATFIGLRMLEAGANTLESELFFALALRSHIRLRVLLI